MTRRAVRPSAGPSLGGAASNVWAHVAHDLRQPVQSMLLLCEVLARSDDQAARRRTAEIMENQILDLQSMLSDLNRLAQLQAAIEIPQLAPIEAAELVQTTVRTLAALAAPDTITVQDEIARLTVVGDKHVLLDLLAGLAATRSNWQPAAASPSARGARDTTSRWFSPSKGGR